MNADDLDKLFLNKKQISKVWERYVHQEDAVWSRSLWSASLRNYKDDRQMDAS